MVKMQYCGNANKLRSMMNMSESLHRPLYYAVATAVAINMLTFSSYKAQSKSSACKAVCSLMRICDFLAAPLAAMFFIAMVNK